MTVAILTSTFGFLCVSPALLQYYLSRHRSFSRWYWRNFTSYSRLVLRVVHYVYFYELYLAISIAFSMRLNLRIILKLLRHAPYSRNLKRIVDKLDHIVDNAPASDLLALGNATLGPALSPFLLTLLDEHDVQAFAQFVETGCMSKEELCAFGNLLAYKLHRQAQLTIDYTQTTDKPKKAHIRMALAQENIEITGVCFALCAQFSQKDPRIIERVQRQEDNQLTYTHLQATFPKTTRAGELSQVIHDTIEFRYDLHHEPAIQKISANYFLALLESHGAIESAIATLPSRTVNQYELPPFAQQALGTLESILKSGAKTMGLIPGLLLRVSWGYLKRIGFYLEKP